MCNQNTCRRRDRIAKHKYSKGDGQEFFKLNKKCLIYIFKIQKPIKTLSRKNMNKATFWYIVILLKTKARRTLLKST